MSIEIYPKDFSTRYELAHVISYQATEYYNDVGKISVVANADDYNIQALKKYSYVYDTEHDVSYVLVYIRHDTTTGRILANGYTVNWLLNQRTILNTFSNYDDPVLWPLTNVNDQKTIEENIYRIVGANIAIREEDTRFYYQNFIDYGLANYAEYNDRNLDQFSIADEKGLSEIALGYVGADPLLDTVIQVLNIGKLGHRMNFFPNQRVWEFEIYKGADKTSGIHAVHFVEEQGTCSNLIITEDETTFKNVVFVKCQRYYPYSGELGQIELRNVPFVTPPAGQDRYEILDDKIVAQEEDEPNDAWLERIEKEGTKFLAERMSRQTFSVDIDASDLGSKYDLGDVVSCASNRLGVQFDARITGVKYIIDERKEKTELILGDPVLTVLGQQRLSGGKNDLAFGGNREDRRDPVLYWEGDEHSDITGGWGQNNSLYTIDSLGYHYNYGPVEKTAESIYCEDGYDFKSVVNTLSKIDTHGYSTLHVVWSAWESTDSISISLTSGLSGDYMKTSSQASYGVGVALYCMYEQYDSFIAHELQESILRIGETQNAYVVIGAYDTESRVWIHRVWLE